MLQHYYRSHPHTTLAEGIKIADDYEELGFQPSVVQVATQQAEPVVKKHDATEALTTLMTGIQQLLAQNMQRMPWERPTQGRKPLTCY